MNCKINFIARSRLYRDKRHAPVKLIYVYLQEGRSGLWVITKGKMGSRRKLDVKTSEVDGGSW